MKRTKPFMVNPWVIAKLTGDRQAEARYLNSMMAKGKLTPNQSADSIAFFLQLQLGAVASIQTAIGADAFYALDKTKTDEVH
jgi:hypothetical protein